MAIHRDEDEDDDTPFGIIWMVIGLALLITAASVGTAVITALNSGKGTAIVSTASGQPPWALATLKKLRDESGFKFLDVNIREDVGRIFGEAPDAITRDAAWTAASDAVRATPEGSALRVLIDDVTVVGAGAGVGAALAGLGDKPDIVACQNAFATTLAGRFVSFREGSAEIDAASARLLDALTGVALICDAHRIEVGGHTSASGADNANMILSQRRADAVKAYLVNKGVSASVMTAMGYGETKLLDSSDTPEAEAKNRRIEFVVSPAM
jgi:outer membrane protein OmpA-like peptidoglycan-associated protein